MRMRFVLIFICLIMGCAADREKQKDYLLPPHNKLQLVKKEETIMATINSYSITGAINQDSLIDYPLERLEGKAIRKWHKASQREAEDLEMFLEEEPIKEDIGKRIVKGIKSDEGYLAYMYDLNPSALSDKETAPKNREALPGEKDYLTANWLDVYYLDVKNNELIHIRYGKF